MRRLASALITLYFIGIGPMAAAQAASAAEPAAFTGKPLAFERKPGAKVVGVYVPNWEPVALVDGIKPGSVSHVLYAFLRICGPGALAKDAATCAGKADFHVANGPKDVEFDAAFQRLKKREPHVKVLASLGGWGGSDPFFHLANDGARRAVFAASAVDFLRKHPGFDGLDIDWEHPGGNGAANGVQLGAPADGQAYADLIEDLRKAVDALGRQTGRRYLVTSAINAGQAIAKRVNYRQAARSLDLLFMMSYDFYGPWTPKAGNHAALRSSAPGADDSLEASTQNMLDAGVPAHKLVAGAAMYGRGFAGVAKPVTGAARSGVFPAGGDDGATVYRLLVTQALGAQGQGVNGYRVVFDKSTQAWSVWNPKTQVFIGYDDPRAVRAKAAWAVKQGLAGIFAWELSQDNGDLMNAMNLGVGNKALK